MRTEAQRLTERGAHNAMENGIEGEETLGKLPQKCRSSKLEPLI